MALQLGGVNQRLTDRFGAQVVHPKSPGLNFFAVGSGSIRVRHARRTHYAGGHREGWR